MKITTLDESSKLIKQNDFDENLWKEAHDFNAEHNPYALKRKIDLGVDREFLKNFSKLTNYEQISEKKYPIDKGKMLEIGSHWGRFSLYKALTCPNLDVVGVDASSIMPEHANKIAEKNGITNVKFYNMCAENLSFPDDCFDVAYAFETLEHVANLDESLLRISKALKKDGCLIFSLPLGHHNDGGFHKQMLSLGEWEEKFGKYFKDCHIENIDKYEVFGRVGGKNVRQ